LHSTVANGDAFFEIASAVNGIKRGLSEEIGINNEIEKRNRNVKRRSRASLQAASRFVSASYADIVARTTIGQGKIGIGPGREKVRVAAGKTYMHILREAARRQVGTRVAEVTASRRRHFLSLLQHYLTV